jgi:16S rRNA processing protein RimM
MKFSAVPLSKVGRITKTHGYEGNVRIDFDDSYNINQKEPLFLMFHQKPVPFFITSFSGSNPFVVTLYTIDSLEKAQDILGKDVFAALGDTEEEDDLSWVGFKLIDTQLGEIGTIQDIIENTAQDIIVTQYKGQECLIPFVEEFIEAVDDENQTLTLNLPEGLLDLES